ncbi:MAG: TonB-dependent receptor, partial [Candidatus Omnitrophica bacterium]|nr:TonB-dependent receptor [Candidatus Omnitrophota bacterium]
MLAKMKLVVVLGGVLLFALAQIGVAQEVEEGMATFDLGEIVVTPTKTERTVGDLSLSVSVITKEVIEASTAQTATDILSILPGVFVHKTGPFGRTDVVIRGHGSRGRRVMVLVDGKPEKMGLFGCTVTHSLPLDNVERIEVVRGPASVLYGSDALGGVINIITKKPKEKFEGDITLSYGSYDTQVYRLRQGGNLERFHYYFSIDERKTRGHLPNSDYEHKNFTWRLGGNLTDNLEAVFTSRYFDGFKREPSPATADTWNDYERGSYDLTLNVDFENISGMFKVYRNFGRHMFSDGWHAKDYTTGAMLHTNFVPIVGNTFSLGGEFRRQGGDVLNGGIKGNYHKDEFAFFIHDEQRLFDEVLIASGGIRYNDDEYSGRMFCPQAGLVFNVREGTIIRAAFNKGFRSPQLNELKFFGLSNLVVNPEETWNYEVGLNQKIT